MDEKETKRENGEEEGIELKHLPLDDVKDATPAPIIPNLDDGNNEEIEDAPLIQDEVAGFEKPATTNGRHQLTRKSISMMHYVKLLFKPMFLLKLIGAILSLLTMILDIYTDTTLAIAHYKGENVDVCKVTAPMNDSEKYQSRKYNYNKYVEAPDTGPKEKYWFILTATFILLPPLLRVFSISVTFLLQQYVFFLPSSCIFVDNEKRRRRCFLIQKGLPGYIIRWSIKTVIFPFFPILIILNQFKKIVITFRIEYREANAFHASPKSYKEIVNDVWANIYAGLAHCWNFLTGSAGRNSKNKDVVKSQVDDNDLLQAIVEKILIDDEYKKSSLCERYDELSRLADDRFYETFIESGPQFILQVTIFIQYCIEIDLSTMALTICMSFFALADAVVSFEIDQLKKNPAKREPTLVGKLLITWSKIPAIVARCLGLSMVFASANLKSKVAGFMLMIFITLVFALVEYAYMIRHRLKRPRRTPPKGINLLIRLISRGFIANFTLLNYRTTYYESNEKKWKDGSDKNKDPPELFFAQYAYYVTMTIVNILLVYFLSGSLTRVSGSLFGFREVDVVVVVIGAPLSMLFTGVYERLKGYELITDRFGVRAMDALQLYLKNKIDDFPYILERLSKKEQERVMNMEDDNGEDLFYFIFHHENPVTRSRMIAYSLQFVWLTNERKEKLLREQTRNIFNRKTLPHVMEIFAKYPKLWQDVIDFFIDKINQGKTIEELGKYLDDESFLEPVADKKRITLQNDIELKYRIGKRLSEISLTFLSDLVCELVYTNNVTELEEAVFRLACYKGELITVADTEDMKSFFHDASQAARRCDVDEATKSCFYGLMKEYDVLPTLYKAHEISDPEADDERWPGGALHVSFVHNGLIYLWTGAQNWLDSIFIPCNVIWTYDPNTGLFARKKISGVVPENMQGACIGVINGKALLFGGELKGEEKLNDLYELELKTLTCRRLDPLHKPSPRMNMSSWVWEEKFFVWRGYVTEFDNSEYITDYGKIVSDGVKRTDQLLVYSENDWHALKTTGTNPGAGDSSIAAVTDEGKVYTIGGYGVDEQRTLYCLDLLTMEWSVVQKFSGIPIVLGQTTAALIKSSYIIMPVGCGEGVYKIDIDKLTFRKMLNRPADGILKFGTVTYMEDKKQIYGFGGQRVLAVSKHFIQVDVAHLI